MIRLIALDLDGTLLDPAGQITDETKAAIAQARQAGIKVVLSTGRSVQEAADFSAQAGCDNLSVWEAPCCRITQPAPTCGAGIFRRTSAERPWSFV